MFGRRDAERPATARQRVVRVQVGVAIAVSLAAGLLVALPSMVSTGDVDHVRTVAGDAPSTALQRVPASSSTTLPSGPPVSGDVTGASSATTVATTAAPAITPSPATTAGGTSSTSSSSSTSTTLACHDSTEPRCGAFRWDPDPGPNAPMAVSITVTPVDPHPGDIVTFHVTASDDDGPIDQPAGCDGTQQYGDEPGPSPCGPAAGCPPSGRFGPWSPPPRQRGELTQDWGHTYNGPGNYKVEFSFNTAPSCPESPYRSSARGSLVVTVTPA